MRHREPLPLTRASRSFRLAAVLLDVALYTAVMLPLALAAFVAVMVFDAAGEWLVVANAFAAVVYGLVQAVLITRTGQSLGKRMLGLRIVRPDGTLPGFARGVLLRSWLFLLPYAAVNLALPELWFLFADEFGFTPLLMTLLTYLGYAAQAIDPLFILGGARRCLHDHVAGTDVVHAATWRPS
jgi:uncharacterized RDD family membrane protein YckC